MLLTSGDSTGLNVEGIAGRVLLILTEVVFLMVWLSSVAGCAHLSCRGYGKRLPLYFAMIYSEVIALVIWALFFAVLAFDYCYGGKHLSVHLTIYDFLLCGRLYCSVILTVL